MHRLFDQFAHRYDLHTPPDHYQHDHQLVLDLAAEQGPGCRILDVGCGTGVLVAKARAAGFDACGLDASESMIAVARTRVPADVVRVQRMQEMEEVQRYDLIVSMSWSIHYCADAQELAEVLRRIARALVRGGRMLLQVAHAANLSSEWMEDLEPGPDGTADDARLRFRFCMSPGVDALIADYEFTCASRGEQIREEHMLCTPNALEVARHARAADFEPVVLWDSWRRDRFADGGSPLLLGVKPNPNEGTAVHWIGSRP